MKTILFKWLFTETERVVIVNALFRRANDKSTDCDADKGMRYIAHQLAMKLNMI